MAVNPATSSPLGLITTFLIAMPDGGRFRRTDDHKRYSRGCERR